MEALNTRTEVILAKICRWKVIKCVKIWLPTYHIITYNHLHSIGPLGEYLLGFHAIKAVKQLNTIIHQLTLLTPDLWAII